MQRFNFAPYEGSDKYIFVSYAHANSHLISDIVERLNSSGYHIWYDSGIEYGEKWIRSIEEHLRRSSIVLSFISPEYSESDWCMREYTYAERIGKKVIHVKIADGVLEERLANRLDTKQIVNSNCYLTLRQIFNEVEKILEKSDVQPLDFTIGYHDDFEEKPESTEEKTKIADEYYPEGSFSSKVTRIYGNKQQVQTLNAEKNNKKKKNIAIIVILSVAVMVIAVVVMIILLSSGQDTKEPVEETTSSQTTAVNTTATITEYTEETTEENTESETSEYVYTEPETAEVVTQPPTEPVTVTKAEPTTVAPTTVLEPEDDDSDYFNPDDSEKPEVEG